MNVLQHRRIAVGVVALVGLALQASAVMVSARDVVSTPEFLLRLQGYGYVSDGTSTGGDSGSGDSGSGGSVVVVTPPTTVVEPGLASTVTVTNVETTTTSATSTTTVSTAAPSGTTAQVQVPPAALPSGATVQVGAITDVQQLIAASPPPAGTTVVAGFQISATSSAGTQITTNFEQPVTVAFSVPASEVPSGLNTGAVELAFWNGSDWVVQPATISQNSDGSLSINAQVTHFTLFSLLKQPTDPIRGAFPPTGKYGLMVWQGITGTSAKAAATLAGSSKVQAIYVLDIARQRFLTYIVGAPAGASDSFTLTKGQPIIVLAPGQAPQAAATSPAPSTSTQPASTTSSAGSSSARRTVTVASGDTLSGIGAKTGVDWQKIASLNGLTGPAYVIQPGQVLYLD